MNESLQPARLGRGLHHETHQSRRSSLQLLGSQALVELSDCCCFRSLPRLGELLDQILLKRQVAQPPLPLDPQILEVVPY